MSEKEKPFRCTLACEPTEKYPVKFPAYGSPKLDGIRCLVRDGVAISRSNKPIRNAYIQWNLGSRRFEGLDGELTVGPCNDPNVMQATSSGVMSADGEPNFTYWVFDIHSMSNELPFHVRLDSLIRAEQSGWFKDSSVKILPQVFLKNQEELDAFEAECLSAGYEGVIVRSPVAPYKQGRSTAREGYMLKIKRFVDEEATIVGFEELMHNENEKTTNELGLSTRSQHMENLVPSGMLGAFWVRSDKYDMEFKIAVSGWTHQRRIDEWNNRNNSIGRLITFKHFPHGQLDVPRHGIAKEYRDPSDL